MGGFVSFGTVEKLVRSKSDHNPLLLNSNVGPPKLKKKEFHFDLAWLKNEDFLPKVAEIWNQPVTKDNVVDVINIKLKKIKKYFKGWGSHLFGVNRKGRNDLKEELAAIEQWEEVDVLPPNMFGRKVDILTELDSLDVEEELGWV